MHTWNVISTAIVNRFGKKSIHIIGTIFAVSVILFLLTLVICSGLIESGIFVSSTNFLKNCFTVLGVLFIVVLVGVLFLGSVESGYDLSHCILCNRDLAYEIIGKPVTMEFVEKGIIKESVTTKYRCRFCGYVTSRVSKYDKYGDMI
jgi:hypothetical protein